MFLALFTHREKDAGLRAAILVQTGLSATIFFNDSAFTAKFLNAA